MDVKDILNKLQNQEISLDRAEEEIRNLYYEDLGYAKIDHSRKMRTGEAEVVFCQGKPNEFLSKIYKAIYKENGEVLGTRASVEQFELIKKEIPEVTYSNISKILKIEGQKELVRKYCDLYRWNIRYSSC